MLTWKLRITVLWIFLAVCQTAIVALLLFQPGVIRGLAAGHLWGVNMNIHSAAVQITFALDIFIPMALAYLTLVLRDTANRRTNTVLGALYVASAISALIDQPAEMSGGVDFVLIVAILVALLIVWHAWKWPRPAEVTPSRPSQETTPQGVIRSVG